MTTDTHANCPDCFVAPGETHQWMCDVSRCKHTGRQLLACSTGKNCGPTKWTGEWPGVKICRDNGWYTTMVGFDGPTEDLNCVPSRAVWNKELEDWESRK